MKLSVSLIVLFFLACSAILHFRGRVRHRPLRQIFDHSSFTAPINVFMLAFSGVPRQPYLDALAFPDLRVLQANWQIIRDEAVALSENTQIKAAENLDDAGFNSFFKTGWARFHLKWYGTAHPSASRLCPRTTALLAGLPSIKAAMFAALPDGARLGKHRDPYAGSLRYHLALVSPDDDRCFIDVDGQRYSWRTGQGVLFDESYIHYAENSSGKNRIVLFCDVTRPMKFRFAQRINDWIGQHLVAAASSPNHADDPTGSINRVFRYAFVVGQARRRFKTWNRPVYQATKLLLVAVVVASLVWA